MAFMIVEGFRHTKNVKKYLSRLALSAIFCHFAYAFCFDHPYIFDFRHGIVDTTSVLWGFTFGLLSLIILHNNNIKLWLKVILISLCLICSIPSNWSWVCVAFLLVIDLNYGKIKQQMFWMTLVGWSYALVYCLVTSWWSAYQFMIILTFPLLYLYNGKRGKWGGMKWLFYLYYPLHLIFLGVLSIIIA